MSAASFIFGGDTGLTPEDIKRRREIANALRGQIGGARDIGSGLADLGKGIAATLMANSADRAERKGRAGANAKFAPLLSALLSGSGPQAPAATPETNVVPGGGGGGGGGGASWLEYANQGATRNKPISSSLEKAMSFLPDMGVTMKVFSGGQDAYGTPGGRRTGSKRHDHGNSADVFFYKDGRKLDWANPNDTPVFQEIVRRGKAAGVAGWGAGEGYMQPGSMHLGFGSPSVWGAGGEGANAPGWLRTAFNGGDIRAVPMPDPGLGRAPQAIASARMPDLAAGLPKPAIKAVPMPDPLRGQTPILPTTQQAPQIAAAPSQAPQIVPTAGPAPQSPQTAPQAPMSAYQRMMATSLGKEAGGLAAPPNRAQMASVMGQGSNGAGGGIMERLFGAGGGAPPSPMAAPQPMSNPNNPQTQATMGPVAANAAAMSPQQVAQGAAQELDAFPNEQLIALMNDPYINDQQRGIVEFVLKKRMEQQFPDPGAQMDMQLKQLQIEEKKKALQPKAGYRPATAAEKQAVGLDPTTPAQVGPDNKVEPISGGANSGTKWREVTLDDGVYAVDEANPQNRVKIGARPDRNEGEGRTFSQETKFRSEYMKESQPFIDLRTNYTRINAASQDQTGASDIALVYSYMKMLDPTSVVREGEFATAENAGGIPQQIQSLYNKAVNGQRLAPEVRADFLKQAKRQYDGQLKTYGSIRKKWQELAVKNGLNPENVAPNINYDEQPAPDSGTKIPAEAIGLLKADPSGEAVREFNEVFGAGAAERILQESANDRK